MVSLRAFPTMYGVRTGASYELSKLEQHRECVKCGEYQHRLLGPEE